MSTSAFGYRDFRLYQAGRFLITIGIQMQSVAVGWHVYELTHRPIDLGYVGLAQFLPLAALSLVTGHTADRFDRRRVLLICYLAIAACAGLLYALSARHVTSMAAYYVVLALFGTARAFTGPAASALLAHIVPREAFANAVAWSSTVWQVAAIVGPAAGGVAFAAFGRAEGVFAVSAVMSLACFFAVAGMRVRTGRMERGAASWTTLIAGVRYVFANKMILGSISLDLFAVLLGGAVALLPMFAKDILHTGPWGLGILRSAPALGAAVTAGALAYRPMKRRAGAIMLACVFAFGIATVVFALSRSVLLSVVALTVTGATDMVSVVVRSTILQLATPSRVRGRVSAVNQVFVGASNELGEFESGLTAAWFGPVAAAAIGGVATCVVVAIWAWKFPALRDVDRLDELVPPPGSEAADPASPVTA